MNNVPYVPSLDEIESFGDALANLTTAVVALNGRVNALTNQVLDLSLTVRNATQGEP